MEVSMKTFLSRVNSQVYILSVEILQGCIFNDIIGKQVLLHFAEREREKLLDESETHSILQCTFTFRKAGGLLEEGCLLLTALKQITRKRASRMFPDKTGRRRRRTSTTRRHQGRLKACCENMESISGLAWEIESSLKCLVSGFKNTEDWKDCGQKVKESFTTCAVMCKMKCLKYDLSLSSWRVPSNSRDTRLRDMWSKGLDRWQKWL